MGFRGVKYRQQSRNPREQKVNSPKKSEFAVLLNFWKLLKIIHIWNGIISNKYLHTKFINLLKICKVFCFKHSIIHYERIRQWPVTDISAWPLVNQSARNIIEQIVSEIWTAAAPILYFSTRGNAVQILKATIHWSLAYSFICIFKNTS